MKTKKTLISLTILTLLLTASYSFARMWGPMHGLMGMGTYSNTLTEDQLSTANKIESKYDKELAAKEAAIRAKATELDKAYINDTSTVKEINILKTELFQAEDEYWQLRQRVDKEVSDTIGAPYYGSNGLGPMQCRWHNDHNQRTGRGYMMHNQRHMASMGGYGPGRCRW